jgi:hypothetical protein
MSITGLMSRMCLAMVAGLALISASAGDDGGQGRGDQPLRFDGPLAVHPRNPRYFVDDSGKAIYLGGHQIFTEIQDHASTKPWVLDWPRHLQFMKERNLNYRRDKRRTFLVGFVTSRSGQCSRWPLRSDRTRLC